MRIAPLSLLLIIISFQLVGCVGIAYLDGRTYVDDIITGRVKGEKPAIDLAGKWKIRAYYRIVTVDSSVPDQDNRGKISLKVLGNGWAGKMYWVDINHSQNETTRKMHVVLSGDKLTMITKTIISTDWDIAYLDLFTGTWSAEKQEFSGSSIGGCKFVMKR
jgi:hypothetical protein